MHICEMLLPRMEAVNRNVGVLEPPCQFFCMQDIGKLGLTVGSHLVVAFIPVEVIPMHCTGHVGHARDNDNPVVILGDRFDLK